MTKSKRLGLQTAIVLATLAAYSFLWPPLTTLVLLKILGGYILLEAIMHLIQKYTSLGN